MPKTMGLLGKKIGMTRVYNDIGAVIPVTVIEAGPCKILQVKSEATDGYNAIQVGFGDKKAQRVNKPLAGHFKKAESDGFYNIREFRVSSAAEYQIGQDITLSELFKIGDTIDVQGVSQGKGFQGVMKRHGFKGGPGGHGSNFHRAPGSIGCSAWPGRVVKGKKLPGRMGNDTVLKKNVLVIDVRDDDNLIIVKGPVPGAKQGLLKLFSK
ncbi:LSU ribosomal protein L3P [Desulfocapsa sulfexigens DSM 10523]|uniref:Large ribosomal subunit protein uL3 n=1 Tax=Desulfocapsa sulfexigens (strain DSM 10523 / SB164P1) TaxID=1167006 RepID=M1PQC0_DESSD|nr:50S ribosomal protein L3 [Desulfocapsa sulfexigens]AGF78591.1 LSU ribosomal protein L3P [Desulfocapsa sulfexigens DSM 10523]